MDSLKALSALADEARKRGLDRTRDAYGEYDKTYDDVDQYKEEQLASLEPTTGQKWTDALTGLAQAYSASIPNMYSTTGGVLTGSKPDVSATDALLSNLVNRREQKRRDAKADVMRDVDERTRRGENRAARSVELAKAEGDAELAAIGDQRELEGISYSRDQDAKANARADEQARFQRMDADRRHELDLERLELTREANQLQRDLASAKSDKEDAERIEKIMLEQADKWEKSALNVGAREKVVASDNFFKLAERGAGTDDVAMIYQFMKALDPASVVREGEIVILQEGASGGARSWYQKLERFLSGDQTLTDDQVKSMTDTLKAGMAGDQALYEQARADRTSLYQSLGLGDDQISRVLGTDIFAGRDMTTQKDKDDAAEAERREREQTALTNMSDEEFAGLIDSYDEQGEAIPAYIRDELARRTMPRNTADYYLNNLRGAIPE